VNPLRPIAIRVGRISWLPRFLPQIEALDRSLQRATRGRVTLLDIAGLPSLMLTVVGRKSGRPRTTPLLYVPHDGTYLVAGSYWGNPKQPVWVLNLLANPDATVSIRGRSRPVRARVAEGEERARLWQVMLRTWPNYAKYAERTDREIPVFVLEPTDEARRR
jgi:deazaflavin-dependent oxidoreductase (nitroreductase family)